jgi:hypothetical protein
MFHFPSPQSLKHEPRSVLRPKSGLVSVSVGGTAVVSGAEERAFSPSPSPSRRTGVGGHRSGGGGRGMMIDLC